MIANRIRDYYDTAIVFLNLPYMAKFVIGTHFKVAEHEDFVDAEDNMDYNIFKRVLDQNKYTEFSQMVRNYKVK